MKMAPRWGNVSVFTTRSIETYYHISDLGYYESVAFLNYLNILEPSMIQRFTCREPLCRIKICQAYHQIPKFFVDAHPQRNRPSRVYFVEIRGNYLEDLAPRAISKVLQKRFEPLFICKIRYLPFKNQSQRLFILLKFSFFDVEKESSSNSIDALCQKRVSMYSED